MPTAYKVKTGLLIERTVDAIINKINSKYMRKILLAACFFLSLLACDKLKSIKSESQVPVNKELERDTVLDEVNTSETEIEIPNTELGFMITYEGKYARQEKLFENEVLASRLKGLDRFNYDIFLKMWNTETPIIVARSILNLSLI